MARTSPEELLRLGVDDLRNGDIEAAHRRFTDAVSAADASGDPTARVSTRVMAVDTLALLGRHEEADALSRAAEDIAGQAGDPFLVGSALDQHGDVLATIGRDQEARARHQQAAAQFAAAGRAGDRCAALLNALAAGPVEPDLQATANEAREQAQALGDPELLAFSTFVSGTFEEHAGRLQVALPAYIEAFEALRQLGSSRTARPGVQIARILRVGHPQWATFPVASDLQRFTGVPDQPPAADATVFVSWRFDARVLPWSGWRVPGEGARSGWYLWTGGEQPDDTDRRGQVFVERSLRSVLADLPELRGYLDLPPDWCFQVAPDHEDVWQPEDIG